jgi:hypothetical protein
MFGIGSGDGNYAAIRKGDEWHGLFLAIRMRVT